MTDQKPISLWDLSSAEPEIAGRSIADREVDVIVVGGGFTGLSTGLHCAEAGLSVQILERGQIGQGGSGRNVGLVNAGVWLPPDTVIARMGPDRGDRFLRHFGEAPSTVFSLIENHQIQCEATRNGTIHAAHAPAGMQTLRNRHRAWRRLGAPVDLLTRREMAERTGSSGFFGGLRDHRAGTINPMGFCRGLARAARAAGAHIAPGVSARSLIRAEPGWIVQTSGGAIASRSVVLGTNAYTDELWPGLSKVLTTIPYFQLATEPLGDRATSILPDGEGLWDTGTIMRSLRRDRENRLFIGSMGAIHGTTRSGISYRWATRQLSQLFPKLGPVRFEFAWDGQIAMTPDHLPRILKLADNLYAPTAYNGRGITTGTIFGMALADKLTGKDPERLPLPLASPVALKAGHRLAARLYRGAFSANQFVRGL